MKKNFVKFLRTAQTLWPPIADTKYYIQFTLNKFMRRPFDKDFSILSHFKPPKNTVFLDIGANRGQSVAAIRLYHSETPIVAFEPARATFSRLMRYTADVGNLTCIKAGLSDAAGHLALHTPVYRGYVFDGLASTIRAEAEEWLNAERIYMFDHEKLKIETEEIEIKTLDSLDLAPCFIKLDVQGAEVRVLNGGRATIARWQPLIMAERAPGDQVLETMASMGYADFRFDAGALRSGSEGCKNAFFLPPARAAALGLSIIH